MKKSLLILVTIAFLTVSSFAQVAINTNGADPDASAILDLSSNNKGLLIPRMTTSNRTTNITPVAGLMVYDTDTESFWYYDGTQSAWTEIKAGSALDINSLADGSSDGTSVFLGDSSGYADNGSNNNVALGIKALKSNIAGKSNVAIGNASLAYSYHNSDLVAIGDSALYNNGHIGNWSVSAIRNTAIGSKSLFSNTDGSYNTANGYMSLYSSTNGSYNVAVGNNSLYSNTNGDRNIAVGNNSLYSNTVGSYNTAIGMNSLEHHKTGNYNTANGYEALYSDTIGENNTAMGYSSLYHNLNGGYNTALGQSSLFSNTSGYYNTSIGASSMKNNTTAYFNTAIGYMSLYRDTTGERNSAIGAYALYNDRSGRLNTANGYKSLYNNTTANSNVAMGSYSLYLNTDRSNLVAIGDSTLFNNGIGATETYHATANIAVGSKTLFSNTTGYGNVGVGTESLYYNTTGTKNTAVGYQAGWGHSGYGRLSSGCVYLGYQAGKRNSFSNKLFIDNSDTGYPLIGGDFDVNRVDINGTIKITGGSPSSGKVLTTDDYGNASWQDTETMWETAVISNDIHNANSGNVGIGTSSPQTQLHVVFVTPVNNLSPALTVQTDGGNSVGEIRVINSAGSMFNFGATQGANPVFEIAYTSNISNGNGLFRLSSTGDLGLGIETPTTKLDINGQIKIHGGAPGSGKVLTSDADGLATWETKTYGATNLNGLTDAITDGSSIFVGDQVGVNDDGTNFNTVLGDEAFKTNTSGQHNTAFGYKTLENSNGGSNSAFGINSLRYNTSGNYNTAVGMAAISYNETGDNNTAIGYNAGFGSSGNSYSGCVFLGYEAGKNNSDNNKLFIANSDDTTPLIGGDFSTDELYFNTSKVGIGTDSPNEILEVTGGTPGNTSRMIVSDGNGSSRKVILFVSPSTSADYARIDAYDYGATTGKMLRINTVGDGEVIFGGNVIPESHKSKNLGSSTKAWDNVYGDDFVNMGAAAFSDINVTKQLLSFPPQEKKTGAFDEFTDKGLKELDPASLPKELTEDNALLIDEMTTYNYKANYEQQVQIEEQNQQIEEQNQQIERLNTENSELKSRLDRLEKLINQR